MSTNLNVINRTKGEKKEGMIPAVMYGHNANSTPIFVNKIEFIKAYRDAGESSIISLSGDHKENILIHDVQMDAVSWEPTHADFYIVKKGQKVNIEIPLEFVNEAPATKLGANIVKVLQELSVEMDPSKAPAFIEVDLSKLVDLTSNITVSDLDLPKEAILYHIKPEDIVVSIVAQSDEDLSASVDEVNMENIVDSVEKGKKEEESEE
ncbi:MAG: large subunit ribosomal protein [Patescibacteria group bacterium]|nr:large subunit ribosomal protein [Patescibacteria group bacterium]